MKRTRRSFLWTAHCWTVLATNPDNSDRRRSCPGISRSALSLFGLAPGGACRAVPVARSAVGSYPTLSPLPPISTLKRRNERRFAFCGAIPGVAPGGDYPPPCRCGARTFLDPSLAGETAIAQPSGSRSRWGNGVRGSRPISIGDRPKRSPSLPAISGVRNALCSGRSDRGRTPACGRSFRGGSRAAKALARERRLDHAGVEGLDWTLCGQGWRNDRAF